MIHHISIPARDPVRVSAVLAEILGGRDFPFSGPLATARRARLLSFSPKPRHRPAMSAFTP